MAEPVIIAGPPGTGKTTGATKLNPQETFVISCGGKGLPIKGWEDSYPYFDRNNPKGNYCELSDHERIVKTLNYVSDNMPHINKIVIDDIQFIMGFEFVDRATEKGYNKFSEMAQHIISILRCIPELRRDINVFITWHDDTIESTDGLKRVLKTVGKLTREKITPDGLTNILLYSVQVPYQETIEFNGKSVEITKYDYAYQTNGEEIIKSPAGMFEDILIPNDMSLVDQKVREFRKK